MENIYQINEHLFISSYRAAKKLKKVKKKGITAIISLMEKKKFDLSSQFAFMYKSIRDRTYIASKTIDEILNFIYEHSRTGKVLVHCDSGISRIGGIIVARLLIENPEWTWDDALKYVIKRKIIEPHQEIKRSILDYFKKIEK
jgi:protein tyrosine phosphatase